MKNLIPVVVVLLLTTGCAPTGPVFSIPDRAGLGAFLAFEVVGNSGNAPAPEPDGGSPAGDWCDECTVNGKPIYPSHPGKVGDGTVFNTCPVCNGTMKAQGSVEEEMQQLEDLQEDELTFEDAVKDITQLGGTSWTIEEKSSRNASDADIREHLVSVHGIDPDSASKMSRQEMLSLHNLLHNTESRSSSPRSTTSRGNTSSSCPSGNCPTSSSSSRSFGLFGRRR